MSTRTPRGWIFTAGLAALAILGALAARAATVSAPTADEIGADADSCFRYGRIECCIKDD
ncbi:MAG: hypothetical protein AAF602_31445 [Myxococcota bacterium]